LLLVHWFHLLGLILIDTLRGFLVGIKRLIFVDGLVVGLVKVVGGFVEMIHCFEKMVVTSPSFFVLSVGFLLSCVLVVDRSSRLVRISFRRLGMMQMILVLILLCILRGVKILFTLFVLLLSMHLSLVTRGVLIGRRVVQLRRLLHKPALQRRMLARALGLEELVDGTLEN